jgi:hypothetical protein
MKLWKLDWAHSTYFSTGIQSEVLVLDLQKFDIEARLKA